MTTTNVNADEISEDTALEMLKASDINIDQQIIRLKKAKAPKQKINALKTQHENIKSKINKIEDKKADEEKAKQEAENHAKQEAENQAQIDAQKKQQEDEQKAQQEAEMQAQIDAQKKQQEEQKAKQSQETNNQNIKPNTSTEPIKQITHNGLDMNQTTGMVDIPALGDWLEQNKGTFTSAQWQNIIRRESMGQVDIQNSSSGAYGVLQLLGHGEHRGMTLGEQLQMAMPLPSSAWAQTAY